MRRIARVFASAAALALALWLRAAAPSLPPDADWLTRAQREIAAREYRASGSASGLQAPNRAHNLRTYFDANGIRVHERAATDRPELLRLRLAGLGRLGSLAPLAPGEIVPREKRVEIRRPGLVEWYVNSPAGLEQGFTLEQKPEGDGALVLELAISGATAALRGDAIALEASHRRFQYRQLAAFDAAHRTLAAHFEVPASDRLRIVVDDADAVYPLSIDPLIVDVPQTQLEPNQANAHMGVSVAGAGDVNGDGYDDVIVSAPAYDEGEADEGAAFVFLGSASGIASGDLTAAATRFQSNQAGASLGNSVAAAGDVNGDGYDDVIIGAAYYNANQFDDGAAFVLLGSATGIPNGNPLTAAAHLRWVQTSEAGFYQNFAVSVAGAGDVNGDGYDDVIVGASGFDGGQTDEGAAFIYRGSATGIGATPAARLESNRAPVGLFPVPPGFGGSVSGAGDVDGDGFDDVIVGAGNYVDMSEGAAFIFRGSALGIPNGSPATAATDLRAGFSFGADVAGAGDVNGDGYADVIVDQDRYTGEAFVFHGSASGIPSGSAAATAATHLQANQPDTGFGSSVAGAGDVNGDGRDDVLVGAPRYYPDTNEGAVFLFLGRAAGIADGGPQTATAELRAPHFANQWGQGIGISVAGAGDVNDDGYADVIASDGDYEAGQQFEGAAFVFRGDLPEPAAGSALALGAALIAALRRISLARSRREFPAAPARGQRP